MTRHHHEFDIVSVDPAAHDNGDTPDADPQTTDSKARTATTRRLQLRAGNAVLHEWVEDDISALIQAMTDSSRRDSIGLGDEWYLAIHRTEPNARLIVWRDYRSQPVHVFDITLSDYTTTIHALAAVVTGPAGEVDTRQ